MPLSQLTIGLQGSCIVAIAVASLLCNTLAVKIGKRPIYLATSVGLMVSCFWAAESRSFGSLTAARAVQGFCMAPMEALVPATIADVWHVHERGFQSAVFNFGVLGGINLASPLGEYSSSSLTYENRASCGRFRGRGGGKKKNKEKEKGG